MGRAMGSASMLIAAAMDLQGPQAELKWQWIADYLYHLAKDPPLAPSSLHSRPTSRLAHRPGKNTQGQAFLKTTP